MQESVLENEEGVKIRTPGIYCILNLDTGMVYVGQTVNLTKRFFCHLSHLRRGKHVNKHLQAAFTLYGESQFRWFILEEVDTDCLDVRETMWLAAFDSTDRTKGYNTSYVGGSNRGLKRSAETRLAMSRAKRAKPISEACKAHLVYLAERSKGVKQTEAHVAAAKAGKTAAMLARGGRLTEKQDQSLRSRKPSRRQIEAMHEGQRASYARRRAAGLSAVSEKHKAHLARLNAARVGKKRSPEVLAAVAAGVARSLKVRFVHQAICEIAARKIAGYVNLYIAHVLFLLRALCSSVDLETKTHNDKQERKMI